MIVDKHLADEIRRGKATVFRIPAKRGKAGAPYAKIAYEPAHDYPVRTGPGKEPVCTIRVASVERERFEPTLLQARAAGFRTTDDYREWWVCQWDRTASGGVSEEEERERRLGWFADRWHGTEVWVITFAVTTDTPLFMAQQRGVAVGDGQYTHLPSRSIDPGAECIDPGTAERYAKRARESSVKLRQSFQDDIAAERARRKAQRRPWINAA